MNGRIYDPELGRFLSPDPNVPNPQSSQAFNRYAYVYNNPLSYLDPTGFIPVGLGAWSMSLSSDLSFRWLSFDDEEPQELEPYTVSAPLSPQAIMRHYFIVLFRGRGTSNDDLYDRRVDVYDASGRLVGSYQGSTEFSKRYQEGLCQQDGYCPEREDGMYDFEVELGFNRDPEESKTLKLEIGVVPAEGVNNNNGGKESYSGVWVHAGRASSATSSRATVVLSRLAAGSENTRNRHD